MTRREAINSPESQGQDEEWTYFMDFTPWGATSSNPVSNPSVKIYDSDLNDVTATHMTGTASVVDYTKVYFPRVKALVAGNRYRVECKVACGSDTWEAWAYIDGEL